MCSSDLFGHEEFPLEVADELPGGRVAVDAALSARSAVTKIQCMLCNGWCEKSWAFIVATDCVARQTEEWPAQSLLE